MAEVLNMRSVRVILCGFSFFHFKNSITDMKEVVNYYFMFCSLESILDVRKSDGDRTFNWKAKAIGIHLIQ